MVGGEHSLKIAAPELLRFVRDSVLKILNKRMIQLMKHSMNDIDEVVYRTDPDTPGLLIIPLLIIFLKKSYHMTR